MQRRELPEVHGVHAGAVLQSHKRQRYAILAGKSGLVSEYEGMAAAAYFEQELCDLEVAVGTSVVERNQAAAESETRLNAQIRAPGVCVS